MEFKQKTTEEKIEIIKQYLNDENSDNIELSLNVFNLIKRGNSFDKSFFEHKSILFNNIIEFVDIKNKLSKELSAFCKMLVTIYYNCIYRCYDFEQKQETKQIPLIYKHLLYQADFLTMSQLAMEYGMNDFTAEYYENGLDILISMTNKLHLFDNFMRNLTKE